MKRALFSILLLAFLFGCASQQGNPAAPSLRQNLSACADKQCFRDIANSCGNVTLRVPEDYGLVEYSSSNCTFVKTLISLDENETPEMRNLLEGKNMTCTYKPGAFDGRLLDTLIYGTENCTGELKDDLGRLVIFS